MKKILAYAMTISLLLCGCSYHESYRGGVEMDKSYKELSTIFRQYGLNGLDDELVYNLEQRYKELPSEIEFNKAANLLTSLGG